MEINSKAPAIARHQIMINASSERIWQVLTNINQWSTWNQNISESKLEGLLKPETKFHWKSNGVSIVSTLKEVEPQHRISWTGKAIGTQAIHVWTLEPNESYILVKTEESFEGWLVTLFKGKMQEMLDMSLQAWLERLKNKAELVA